jgi:hypothetical protein
MSMNSSLLVEGVSVTGKGGAMIGTYDSYQASFCTHFLSPILVFGPRAKSLTGDVNTREYLSPGLHNMLERRIWKSEHCPNAGALD